uniref:Uncharacterized protein n=1 Tax=Knipowitschia caucasica TaxID=637954 RepID=A0AAV2JPM8_KNICA
MGGGEWGEQHQWVSSGNVRGYNFGRTNVNCSMLLDRERRVTENAAYDIFTSVQDGCKSVASPVNGWYLLQCLASTAHITQRKPKDEWGMFVS